MSRTGLFSNRPNAKNNIFISYRVHDTAGETGRLVDSLKQHFSDDQIFMDIEKIEPGVDFTEAISRSLELCKVMLVIIGHNWIASTNGKARINNINDWVRIEVATALKRDIKVIPVLVDGSQLPEAEDIPDDLQSLLRRQAIEISNKRWKYDTDQLVDVLKKAGIPPLNEQVIKPQKSFWAANAVWMIALIGVIAFIVILKSLLTDSSAKKDPGYTINPNATTKDSVVNRPVEPLKQPETNTEKIPQQTTEETVPEIRNVRGTWVNDAGDYLVINQENEDVDVVSYLANGQVEGSGQGKINGSQLSLFVNTTLLGLVTVDATVTANSLNGKVRYKNNGGEISGPFYYTRR